MVSSWGSAGTCRETRHCIFNSLLFPSWRNKSCSLLSSWTDQRKRTGQRSSGNGKCQSIWSKGLEIKLAVISGQDTKITEVSALLNTLREADRRADLREHTAWAGKGSLPLLYPCLPKPSFSGWVWKKICLRHTHEALLHTFIFRLSTLILTKDPPKLGLGKQTTTKMFISASPGFGTSTALSRHSLLQFYPSPPAWCVPTFCF